MAERRNGLTVVIVAADTDLAVVDFDWARALSTCSRARGPLVKQEFRAAFSYGKLPYDYRCFLVTLTSYLGLFLDVP